MSELARLREITLHDCEMSVEAVQDLLLAIFKQDVVNLERFTVVGSSSDLELARVQAEPHFWTTFLRRELKRDVCVECS